ncbi:MAG: beta-ketoacyl synthase N-terminal-like domain-containing protein [Gemmatimonadetes bacterium]|nr:beta-ketoacyl synthase N-terminal-like domain-containing protein [Gemmatimonadota bacterium]
MSGSPIAVVGLSAILPGSDDIGAFWENIREARDCFSDVPESHWRIEDYFDPTPRAKDKTYGKRGGFINAQPFDALGFGLPPSSLPSTDVAQLLALLVSQRCIADADNGKASRFDRNRTSVILGGAATTALVSHMSGRMAQPMWRQGLRNAGFDEASVERACVAISDQFVPWQESTFPGLLGNVIAGRIANRFDLGGTNCVLDAACASSLAAVSMAMDELRSGKSDTVITGGVDALNDILMFMCFSQTPALSLSGDCKPFSDQADGTMLGEGVAMLALRRLEDAERDGHKIYATIRGLGSSSDGRAKSVYAPRPEGQVKALERAYVDAGYSQATVDLVEAHGTGTTAGDAAEVSALKSVFGAVANGREAWCALGSVKAQIGHTKAAAGAASLVKAVLALQHQTLPPTAKVNKPNPALGLEGSPFYLSGTARPWFKRGDHPRRASVSSFGFGGSNFHVTLEEYTGPNVAARHPYGPVQLVLIGGPDENALRAGLADLTARVKNTPQLASYARESHASFDHKAPMRLALLVNDFSDLVAAVAEGRQVCDKPGDVQRTHRTVLRRGTPALAESVAFLFPGQGSQYLGMGRDLALHFSEAFAVWERAAHRVADAVTDLGDVVFPRPAFERIEREAHEARLRMTAWAQPALAAASLAQLALLEKIQFGPSAAAGHSFGELVALHAGGAYDADTLLDLARARGEAMASCATPTDGIAIDAGSMFAVAGDVVTVQGLLDRFGDGRVVVANDNHPRQTVLSGPTDSLRAFGASLTQAGLSHQALPVAAAFHSPLVAPAAAQFAAEVSGTEFGGLHFPVVANGTAQPYENDVVAVRERLAHQLAHPVRFRESVDALYELGCRVFVEVGAGNVLSGLVKKCLADRPHVTVALDTPGEHGVRAWWIGMAELATLGLAVNLAAIQPGVPAFDAVPAPPSGPAVVAVGGSNLGKPYPPKPGAMPASPAPTVQLPVAHLAEAAPVDANDITSEEFFEEPIDITAEHALSPDYAESYDGDTELEVYEDMDDQNSSLLLEAQRLTQQAILDSFAMTMRGITGNGDAPAPTIASRPVVRVAAPAPVRAPVRAPAAAPVAAPPAPHAAKANGASPAAAPAPKPAPVAAPVATPAPAAASAADGAAMVLGVIAEKTGYPVDALAPELELEADLGIDSIKRVEILAALSDKMPGMDPKSIDPAKVRRVSDLLVLLGEAPPVGPKGPLGR